MHGEYGGNPLFPAGVAQARPPATWRARRCASAAAIGGLFAAVTTGTSTGAINALHDSFQPIGGLVPLFNMELGEITPAASAPACTGCSSSARSSRCSSPGLMVGRTPEYLGKKVEAFEIKMAMLTALVLGASILGFTALASVLPEGTAGPLNPGPHGFTEILYAFSSQTGNNGSAFARPDRQHAFYNVTGALAMLIGRYGMIVPILALAGSMAAKRRVAPSLGHVPDHRRPVDVLLIGVVIIVGALTFFPALSLGPIVEQLIQNAGKAS